MLRVLDVLDPPRSTTGRVDLDALTDAVAAVRGGTPWLLESAPGAPSALGWSALVVGSAGRLVVPPVGDQGTPDPFARLDRLCERLGLDPTARREPGRPACDGGLLGAISYDAGRAVERLPAVATTDRVVPSLDVLVADVVLHVDHATDEVRLLHRPLPTERTPRAVAGLGDQLRAAWTTATTPSRSTRHEARSTRHEARSTRHGAHPATSSLPAGAYRAAVAAALVRIAAGDTFQVNLSQRLRGRWDGDLLELYRALRGHSTAPHGAVLPTTGAGIASVSPETFVRVDSGHVTVRPIKGTRPRSEDPSRDRAAADELAASAKDRAENVMVVDLERNDLGRVCRPGTVRVPSLLELEAHPTVWHLVSEVVGELRPGTTWGELLRATFPCGSVTGAPKVSSMGIIDRLEPVRRNWYCGAFGWLGDGGGSTAVAIRTASLWPDGAVDYGAGGGVVADSDPDAEHRESLDKAAAFLRTVAAGQPG